MERSQKPALPDGIKPLIFVSYRRSDTPMAAGRIADYLAGRYSRRLVFRDVQDIGPGEDFVDYLEHVLAHCKIFIPIIGEEWRGAGPDEEATSRLHNPEDWVRLEIEAALKHEMLIFPVLVEGATMPDPKRLPDSIVRITRYNAVRVADQTFHNDMQRLTTKLDLIASRNKYFLTKQILGGYYARWITIAFVVVFWFFGWLATLANLSGNDILIMIMATILLAPHAVNSWFEFMDYQQGWDI